MKTLRIWLATATVAASVTAGPAQALTFVLNNTGGAEVGTQARKGFEIATRYWSSVLTDNVTMNLDIGFAKLDPGVLGSTGSARSIVSMTQAYNALAADRTSALDNAAVASLRPLGTSAVTPRVGSTGAVTAITNNFNGSASNGYTDTSTRIDNDGSWNNSALSLTKANAKANAKALGIWTDVNNQAINYNSSDANVTFSSTFNFDFDPTDGISSNAFDFIGIAIHEIGHALGFVSGVDTYDARTAPGQTNSANLSSLEGSIVASQLDLFRYGSEGSLDWSTQGNPYFSIDGGKTQLFGDSRFSTGRLNGDGQQASHWKDSPANRPQLGILDPTSAMGQMQQITALDLAAYDAMGWNIGFDVLANRNYRYSTADAFRAFGGASAATAVAAAVPEPATWAMMLIGFGMVGAAARYRRRDTKVAFA